MREEETGLRHALRKLRAAALVVVALSQGCGGNGSSPTTTDPETGQPTATTFAKSFGGPGFDFAHAARATSDGGLVFVGHAGVPAGGVSFAGGDLWLAKLDANGNAEAERLLGATPSGDAGTETLFTRVRALADGYIAVGTSQGNVRVARLDAGGAVLWAQSYDSGPWLNYEGTSSDQGRDVAPLPDGGFWVVAESRANLRDVRGIGWEGFYEGREEFVGAKSVFALRLDADGNVRARRRLTEGAFGAADDDLPIVRATHDGGAVVARRKRVFSAQNDNQVSETYTLIQRLQGDATLLWTRRIDGALIPADLVQTDDAVDRLAASPDFVRDGVSDDGFVFAGNSERCARLVKLDAEGEVEWSNGYDCDDLGLTDRDLTELQDVLERCVGASPVCTYVVAGSRWVHGEEHRRAMIRHVFATDGAEIMNVIVADPSIHSVERVWSVGSSGAYHAATRAYSGDGAHLLTLDRDSLAVLGQILIRAEVANDTRVESTPTAGALLFDAAAGRVTRVAASGDVATEIPLAAGGVRTDRGLAVAEVAPGRYVVAGESTSFGEMEGDTDAPREAWLAAYDLQPGRPDGFRWQRRFAPGRSGTISALAAAGDGGVVAGGIFVTELAGGRAYSAARALRFDADGALVWQSAPLHGRALTAGTELRDIDATPDGGFVTLVAEHTILAGGVVAKLGADGAVSWKRHYPLEKPGSIEPVDADADGARDDGFVLAGGGQSAFALATVVRLDAAGGILWSRNLRPDVLTRWIARSIGRPRIRQSRDGGFVLAITESGDVTTLDENGVQQPHGQSNILVLKLDAEGTPQWGRVYGGRYDEDLSDLDVAPDGSIIVAGSSDSMGDYRDAWLLKLGPDGLIANSGCNAYLASMPAWFLVGDDTGVAPAAVASEGEDLPAATVASRVSAGTARAPTDLVTARQCLGSANPTTILPNYPRVTLTVSQVGSQQGVVTSIPRGILCGTAAGAAGCTAQFPEGIRVTLRAESVAGSFRRWESDCEEGTGGTSTMCVVTLAASRTVAVNFGAPPQATMHPFRIAVQGEGQVTGAGLACREGGASTACSRDLAQGATVNLVAAPDAGSRFVGWSVDCAAFGTQGSITLVINGPVQCFAQFSAVTLPGPSLLSVQLSGAVTGAMVESQPAGISCVPATQSDCSETFATGTEVVLRATPGARLVSWQGCDAVLDLTFCRVIMGGPRTVTAEFRP